MHSVRGSGLTRNHSSHALGPARGETPAEVALRPSQVGPCVAPPQGKPIVGPKHPGPSPMASPLLRDLGPHISPSEPWPLLSLKGRKLHTPCRWSRRMTGLGENCPALGILGTDPSRAARWAWAGRLEAGGASHTITDADAWGADGRPCRPHLSARQIAPHSRTWWRSRARDGASPGQKPGKQPQALSTSGCCPLTSSHLVKPSLRVLPWASPEANLCLRASGSSGR